jgi:hypothetical protein
MDLTVDDKFPFPGGFDKPDPNPVQPVVKSADPFVSVDRPTGFNGGNIGPEVPKEQRIGNRHTPAPDKIGQCHQHDRFEDTTPPNGLSWHIQKTESVDDRPWNPNAERMKCEEFRQTFHDSPGIGIVSLESDSLQPMSEFPGIAAPSCQDAEKAFTADDLFLAALHMSKKPPVPFENRRVVPVDSQKDGPSESPETRSGMFQQRQAMFPDGLVMLLLYPEPETAGLANETCDDDIASLLPSPGEIDR